MSSEARGWPEVPTEALFDMQLGKMMSKAAKRGEAPYPYLANRNVRWHGLDLDELDWMDFSARERDLYALAPGDILVCEGGTVGRAALWRGELQECYYQKALHRLRARDARVDPRYMVWYLHWAVWSGRLDDYTGRTSIPHLTQEKLATVPVPVPPVDVQRRIADALDEAQDAVTQTEDLIAKLERVHTGVREDLLTRGIDGEGGRGDRLRDPIRRPQQFYGTELGPLPKGWRVVPVDDVLCKPPRAGFSPKTVSHATEWAVLGLGCLTPSGFAPAQIKNAPDRDPGLERARLAHGDLLISRANTRSLVGMVGRYCDIGRPCIYPDLMMRLVTNERAMPGFLALTLQSRASRAQIEGAARGTSESMVKLTAHTIAQLRIPLPCWDEQNEIFIAHQDIYRRLWNERRLRGKYERLRDGLMDDLFRGVVRA